MIRVHEVIVVEGKYDKNALSQIFDAVIVETSGFGIFSDAEKVGLLRKLADARGLVVLTDSDGGGFVIRNFLKGSIDPQKVRHAYIPEISGREKRKSLPSKEGKLGVEGMSPEVLVEALRRAGATLDGEAAATAAQPLTKADLYAVGLLGGKSSAEMRHRFLKGHDLPAGLSSSAMLDVINVLMTREKFLESIILNTD